MQPFRELQSLLGPPKFEYPQEAKDCGTSPLQEHSRRMPFSYVWQPCPFAGKVLQSLPRAREYGCVPVLFGYSPTVFKWAILIFSLACSEVLRLSSVRPQRIPGNTSLTFSQWTHSLCSFLLHSLHIESGQDWEDPCHPETQVYALYTRSYHIATFLENERLQPSPDRQVRSPLPDDYIEIELDAKVP
eukprot:TCALIF_08935-PA protein Name:"Protein of unknown function" AED:0.86 eAED:0.86 QI:0/0/0/0.33/1/1/3/0/187